MRLINRRIDERRASRRVSVAEISRAVGMAEYSWYRKIALTNSFFSTDEISKIAEFLEAPIGWPFLDEEDGGTLEGIKNGSIGTFDPRTHTAVDARRNLIIPIDSPVGKTLSERLASARKHSGTDDD